MKKKMFAVLAGVMVLMLGSVTVFASPSNEGGQDDAAARELAAAVSEVTTESGLPVETAPLTQAQLTAGQAAVTETLKSAGISTEGKNVTTVAALDVTVPAATAEQLAAGVPVTFKVAGIVEGKTYQVLHQKADGTWEVLASTIANGQITAIFHSFSPVLVVEIADQTAVGATSPKTGETAPVAAAAAVLMFACAAFCAKRVRFN